MGWVIAAYGVVFVAVVGYWARLRIQRRDLSGRRLGQ